MSAEYALALTTPGAVRSSFESEYAAVLDTQLGLDASVSSVSFGAATADRRRMQNDEVVINYVVQCGAGGCLQAKDKLDHMSTKQMSNIIQAIDDHAFKTGFGTSAVSPSSPSPLTHWHAPLTTTRQSPICHRMVPCSHGEHAQT